MRQQEENIDEGNAKKSEKVAPDDKIGDANMGKIFFSP